MNILDKLQTRLGPLGDHAHYAHGYYAYPRLEGEISNKMTFNGKEKLVWSLNNYLGLANHPEVREADNEGTKRYGLAYPMGARMMSGNTKLHERFETEIADYVQKEDAFLLNYGYQGMVSIIDSLVDRQDVVVYDAESHACIIDGMRLHMGKRFVFKHNDIEDCERQLQRAQKITEKTKGAILLITEGVFGMRGDQGKLKEIVDLKENYNFSLLVDDAHGIGILGESGHGVLGLGRTVKPYATCVVMPLGKAFCGLGAIVAGKESIINIISQRANTYRYTTALPPGIVSGLKSALELVIDESWRRDKLHKNIKFFNSVAEEKKIILVSSFDAPIRTILVADIKKLLKIQNILIEKGFYVSAIRPPTVPEKKSRIRISVNALHSDHEIYLLLSHIATILHEK